MIITNRIKTPDGTILDSSSVHDYVGHTDENGKYYAVDGGKDYLKRCGPSDYLELSITDEDSFSVIRENFLWGTYGKYCEQPYQRIALKDLTNEHIDAILNTQNLRQEVGVLFRKELMFRES